MASNKNQIALAMAESMLRESGYQVFKEDYQKTSTSLLSERKVSKSYEEYLKNKENHSNEFLAIDIYRKPIYIKLLYNETVKDESRDTIIISSMEPFVRIYSDNIKIPLHVLIKYRDLIRMKVR